MRLIAAALGLVLAVSACSASPPESDTRTLGLGVEDAPPAPELDASRVIAGQFAYLQKCATCHRPNLSGGEDRKARDEDGSLKPPQLNFTGHAWYHSDSVLIEVVTDGSFDPDWNMNGFAGELSDTGIRDVTVFVKSTWGPEERSFQWFATWQETEQ